MMPLGWSIFAVGLASGLLLRFRGMAVPVVVELALWIIRDITGHYTGTPGENVAAQAALAGILGALVGVAGAAIGATLRIVARRLLSA
jgi:hypothetical protein